MRQTVGIAASCEWFPCCLIRHFSLWRVLCEFESTYLLSYSEVCILKFQTNVYGKFKDSSVGRNGMYFREDCWSCNLFRNFPETVKLEKESAEFAVFIVWKHLGWWWNSSSILGMRALTVFVTHPFREAVIIANTLRLNLKSLMPR